MRHQMSTYAVTHPTHVLSKVTARLGWGYAALLVLWAIAYPQVDKTNSEFAGSVINVMGAVLIVAGLLAFTRTSPWVAVGLVTVGAVLGTLPVYWVLLTMLAMIALIVLVVRDAREARRSDRIETHLQS
jgi:di/tricarboxylate transporter